MGGPTESTKLGWSFAIDPVLTPNWSSDDRAVLKCLLLPDWSLGFGSGNEVSLLWSVPVSPDDMTKVWQLAYPETALSGGAT
jgi:hypothetical protein